METAQVSQVVSPNDAMFAADHSNLDLYLRNGRSALEILRRYCDSPTRILDFGCGHGRVLRHIVTEWPEAEVWASDLDRDAVEFCQREFGVKRLPSAVAPEDVRLPRVDLIWAGSVFSHLEPVAWRGFLRLLADSLDGVFALSLLGPYVADQIRGGEEMGVFDSAEGLLRDFDATGLAFRDYTYGRRKGYGLTLCSPDRIRTELEAVGLRMVGYEPQGWMGGHDVVVAQVG